MYRRDNSQQGAGAVLLLITALIWGCAFVAQSVAMDHVGPFTFCASRFMLSGFAVAAFLLARRALGYNEARGMNLGRRRMRRNDGIAGGIICGPKTCDVLVPGDHGSTFGMNPVACAGACVVLDTLDEAFLESVRAKADRLRSALSDMKSVTGLDGLGMMVGIDLAGMSGSEAVSRLMEEGALAIPAQDRLRLLPPLTISDDELTGVIDVLKKVLD